MLCGLTSMSIGECRMPGVQLSDSVREWQSHLGYCPQDDALMDAFTGNEILGFFARLRGVPEDKVRVLVDSAAFVAYVGDDGLQLCETYSSGTRRKLSTAVAVIGCPRVVILDDATGGVDLVGREMIYETLQDITRVGASGVLFTSRSTEECKMACHRVGIMAGGELKALGTMEQLKDTFARGCTISFRIFEKFTGYVGTAVDKGVQQLFPGARQAECREGVFLYYIDYRLPWSRVFSRINKLRRWFVVESVLVSESSLDEVLLGMARAEQAEDSAEAQLAAKDASRDLYAGDPWGREEQHKHERRQRLREKRRRRDSPTQASEYETHSRHGTGTGVEV
ncbi:phospholipid-transporting ATPase ABCA3-like isoform X2 [Dermacentor andersoni]|uniref:phospholipid-transporting ATPase ABCA3-like isoform X2 n=1 Tax=Dermacentor andersoni TaxID=34620 RepID=UPI0024165363|nr:phospholipid-transporting ATPase ABCA3-like [Dermacentor andersoni]